jgi:hypothetical protein
MTTKTMGQAAGGRGRKPREVSFRLEQLEVAFIREEVPGPLGLVLALALRDLTLWAHVAPVRRGGLFDTPLPAIPAYRPEPLQEALELFDSLALRPEGSDARALAGACGVVAEWAEGLGRRRTAQAFRAALPLLERARAA